MMDWLGEFYLGIFLTWLAVLAWDRLQEWWAEGKQDLKIDIVDHDDPIVQHVERRTL